MRASTHNPRNALTGRLQAWLRRQAKKRCTVHYAQVFSPSRTFVPFAVEKRKRNFTAKNAKGREERQNYKVLIGCQEPFSCFLWQTFTSKVLKEAETSPKALEWNLSRAISKINYKIHTDAVKENLVPHLVSNKQQAFTYANEADMLNVALFGKTAKEWKAQNPAAKGNMRDDATIQQLIVLSNMESMNAELPA